MPLSLSLGLGLVGFLLLVLAACEAVERVTGWLLRREAGRHRQALDEFNRRALAERAGWLRNAQEE